MFSVFSLDESIKISLHNYDRYSKDGEALFVTPIKRDKESHTTIKEYLGEASIQLDFLEYYNGKETEKISLNLGDAKSGSVVIQMAYRTM